MEAVRTPLLDIPKYTDLAKLFKEVYRRRGGGRRTNPDLNKEDTGHYSLEEYNAQFAVRVPELLAKIDRMIGPEGRYVTEICDAPEELHTTLVEIRRRLLEAQEKFGDCITPDKFETIG